MAWLPPARPRATEFSNGEILGLMWVKQCHKPPIWEWFTPPIKMVIYWSLIIASWFCYDCIIGVSWFTTVGVKLKIVESLSLDASIYRIEEESCSWRWHLRYHPCVFTFRSTWKISLPLEGDLEKLQASSEPWKIPQSRLIVVVGWLFLNMGYHNPPQPGSINSLYII